MATLPVSEILLHVDGTRLSGLNKPSGVFHRANPLSQERMLLDVTSEDQMWVKACLAEGRYADKS